LDILSDKLCAPEVLMRLVIAALLTTSVFSQATPNASPAGGKWLRIAGTRGATFKLDGNTALSDGTTMKTPVMILSCEIKDEGKPNAHPAVQALMIVTGVDMGVSSAGLPGAPPVTSVEVGADNKHWTAAFRYDEITPFVTAENGDVKKLLEAKELTLRFHGRDLKTRVAEFITAGLNRSMVEQDCGLKLK
jgi:hypothetical protein